MKRRISQEGQDTEVDLTPMLDVVFIMLIFFIVTATFVREKGIEVLRPDESEDPPTESVVAIVIRVDESNDIWIEERIVDLRAVRANVERMRAENAESPVLIQADREADTGIVIGVMDQARLAQAPAVSIATVE